MGEETTVDLGDLGPPQPRASTWMPGTLVAGRYRVVRTLGSGGMGEVYEAEDRELRTRVALKAIRPGLARSPEDVDRFRREINLARRVSHGNVCRVFDIGHDQPPDGDPQPFLSMELLEGETLAERLRRDGRIGEREAMEIVRQMAAALAAAHREGITHRDFKSANVMLAPAPDGVRAVVTDFGLARTSSGGVGDASLTGRGELVGTPHYMAPEQVEGRQITPSADIYALGVVMYEMVTGVRPFEADTPVAAAVRRLTEKPAPPRKHATGLDPRWEAVILRCLERDPGERFARVEDVVRALEGGAETMAATRPSLAFLGFRNLTGRPEAAWMSTALAEMLGMEVAASEKVRVVPGELVTHAIRELSLPETESYGPETLASLRRRLGTDFVATGSYVIIGAPGTARVRIDLRVQSTETGAGVVAASEGGAEADLFDLVARLGTKLREWLGIDLSVTVADAVKAARPPTVDVAKLYAEGLEKLRLLDVVSARKLLEEAVRAQPSFALARMALADALEHLGYHASARDEAKAAQEASEDLPREERLLILARWLSLSGDHDRAAEIHRQLYNLFPDSVEHGLALARALTNAGQAPQALAVLAVLSRLAAPGRDDSRVDLAESRIALAHGDLERALAAARRAVTRGVVHAEASGGYFLMAEARTAEAKALASLGRIDEGLVAMRAAALLHEKAGDPRGSSRELEKLATFLEGRRDPGRVRQIAEEAVRGHRAAGDEPRLAQALRQLTIALAGEGDFAGAEESGTEALALCDRLGDRLGSVATLQVLADVSLSRGAHEEADDRLATALALAQEAQAEPLAANVTWAMGRLRRVAGSLASADELFRDAASAYEGLGRRHQHEGVLCDRADLCRLRNDLPGAHALAEMALQSARERKSRHGEAEALEVLGHVVWAMGHVEAAAELHAETRNLWEQVGLGIHAAMTDASIALVWIDARRTQEGLSLAERATRVLRRPDGRLAEVAWSHIVRCLVEAGRASEARALADEVTGFLAARPPSWLRGYFTIEAARARAVSGSDEDRVDARTDVAQVLAQAQDVGCVELELSARLVEAELDLWHAESVGATPAGVQDAAHRRELAIRGIEEVEEEARRSGWGLIALRAGEALRRHLERQGISSPDLLAQAQWLRDEQRPLDASRLMRRCLWLDPNDEAALVPWGELQRELRGDDGYLAAMGEVGRTTPGTWRPWLLAGRELLRSGDLQGALGQYRKAVRGDATGQGALRQAGNDLLAGHAAEAVDLLEAFYDPRRDGAEGGALLVQGLAALGRSADARRWLDELRTLLGAAFGASLSRLDAEVPPEA